MECVQHTIPHDFNFGLYLKKTLAHSYSHIIEISAIDWGILWFFMGLLYTAYFAFPKVYT